MYEFNPVHAYDFANHMSIRAFEKGYQLHFKTCPYCKGTGRGNENTFAIDLKTGQFKCLRASCNASGNMVTLARDFDFSLGSETDEYYRPKKQYRHLPQPKEKIIPKSPAVAYLESRGIDHVTAEQYEITTQAKNDNILVFPFFDDKGILQFVKYRKTDFNPEKDNNKEWCEKNCRPILFGMKQCKDFKRLIVTEGQCFDGKAEILTPNGWVAFENYSGQDVLQINEDMQGEFVKPNRYIVKRHIGDMVKVEIGGNYESYTTDDHKLVFINDKGNIVKKKASEKISAAYKIPTVVTVNSQDYSNWTNDMFALYLAVSADGSIDYRKGTGRNKPKSMRYVRFSVALERKAKELRKILSHLGITYSDNKEKRGYDSICFCCPDWIQSKYLPYEFATKTTVEQKKFIIGEMVNWDDNKVNGRNQYEYTTILKHNADVMQLIASTSGYMSTIMTKQNGRNGNFLKSYCYKVSILLKKQYVTTQQFENHKKIIPVDQRVYCVSVDTGMILVRQNGKISVTGNCDSLSVAAAGIENAVSVPTGAKGFTWVPYCWEWVRKFEEIVMFGDFEKGKMTLLEDFQKRFPNKILYVQEKDYKGCKDANELLVKFGKAAVREAVGNAKMIPVSRVLSLSEVEAVDIYRLPKLKSGIGELDRLLYGGLPFGQVHLIAGKRGDGKSTFASQIMAEAIEQELKVFVYSGELPNYLFKSWLDFQIAGKQHITETVKDGKISRSITRQNQQLINDWYQDKAYIYDSRIIDTDEQADLLKTLEQVIMQYGIKVILIDNLMTALDLDAEKHTDRYDRQSSFVKRLTRIALRYDIIILLVAHRRKNGYSTDANEEISGSGDITNLAGVILSYDRDNELSASQRRLIVSKNRLFGKLEPKGFVLDYEERSKRIYGGGDNVNRQYSWDKSDGFVLAEDMEIPF